MPPHVITRFAPSPTGALHLGGARTALFNYLFARHEGGKFLLRIEDTDKARSTQEAHDDILENLKWLGLSWDGDIVYQSKRRDRHIEVANQLLESGHAYRCICTPERLEEMRTKQRADNAPLLYDGRCREEKHGDGQSHVVRFKSPQTGKTTIADRVQGDVVTENAQLDDLILLRTDGSPTYMLCVVVDDHDMHISHVIRGVDHLTNAARQSAIYDALGWDCPVFAHIPLIHNTHGKKLSKRTGDLVIEDARNKGYLPEAMRNYLARLGWAHGDDEIFSDDDARRWFSLEAVGRSPARFDNPKLNNLNAHYLRNADTARLVEETMTRLESDDKTLKARLEAAMPDLTQRAETLHGLALNAGFLVPGPLSEFAPKAQKILDGADVKPRITRLVPLLESVGEWRVDALEACVKGFAEDEGIGLRDIAQPLRAALTGLTVSPGIFEVLAVLGRDEALSRLRMAGVA